MILKPYLFNHYVPVTHCVTKLALYMQVLRHFKNKNTLDLLSFRESGQTTSIYYVYIYIYTNRL